MSSIFGILSCKNSQHGAANLTAMMDTPPYSPAIENGQYHFNPISLAFQNSTSESPHAHQPMTSQDRRYTVAVVGAIDNYLQLRPQFLHPVLEYETQSDIEVLLFTYDRMEENAFPLLSGKFTLALWDNYERRLTFARDQSGAHSLFYYLSNDLLIFASTAAAIMAHPAYQHQQSNSPSNGTLPSNITVFPPGHYAHINPDAHLDVIPVPFRPNG